MVKATGIGGYGRPAGACNATAIAEAARQFFELLGAKYCTFQTFDDRKPRKPELSRVLYGSLSEHSDQLRELNGHGAGVFFSVNPTDRNGRKRENIESVRALMLDSDGSPLDPVLNCNLQPHIVVETSPGRFQAYWLVKGFPPDKFEDVQRAIAKRFDGDPAVALLNVCARVPGFFHQKGSPFRVRIVESNSHPPFSEDEILREFPPEAYPHKPGSSRILPKRDPVKCAEEFVRHHYFKQDTPCLHHFRGTFYEWRDTHFSQMDADRVRSELYGFLHGARTKSNDGFSAFTPTARDVYLVMHALRSGVYLEDRIDPPFWQPQSENGRPTRLIAFQNGLFDLASGELLPHSPLFFNLNALPYNYDPDAAEPIRFKRFLHELFGHDEEGPQLLQEFIGLLLTADTNFQKILLIQGPRRSGKGTLEHVITELVGRENVTNPTMGGLGSQFGLSALINKSVAIIPDARFDRGSQRAVEHLLSISGEGRLNIDRKYMPHWTGKLGVRFVVLTNELPNFLDVSGALASRFLIISLKNSFFDREQLNLKDELSAELPGILNWAVEGLKRLKARGHFVIPESSQDARLELEELWSPVRAFVRECCALEPAAKIIKTELHKAHQNWCNSRGYSPLSQNMFGRDLKAAFPGVRPIHSGPVSLYRGIRLNEIGRDLLCSDEEQPRPRLVRRRW